MKLWQQLRIAISLRSVLLSWSKQSVMNIKGAPFRLRPHSEDEIDAVVEESHEPHLNADQHFPDEPLKDVFVKPELKKLDDNKIDSEGLWALWLLRRLP